MPLATNSYLEEQVLDCLWRSACRRWATRTLPQWQSPSSHPPHLHRPQAAVTSEAVTSSIPVRRAAACWTCLWEAWLCPLLVVTSALDLWPQKFSYSHFFSRENLRDKKSFTVVNWQWHNLGKYYKMNQSNNGRFAYCEISPILTCQRNLMRIFFFCEMKI